MNSSKFFLSTLIAAAAMTVPAYAVTGTQIYNTAQTLTEGLILNQNSYRLYNAGLDIGTHTLKLHQTEGGYITTYIKGLSGSGTINLLRDNESGEKSNVLWVDGDCSGFTGNITANQVADSLRSTFPYVSTRLILGSETNTPSGLNLSNATVSVDGAVLGLAGNVTIGTLTTTARSQVGAVNGAISPVITGEEAGTFAKNDEYATPITDGSVSRTITVTKSATISGTPFLAGVNLTFAKEAEGTLSDFSLPGVLTNAGNIALSGTVSLSSAIRNSGVVALDADVLFDLKKLTVGEDGKTYTLIDVADGGTSTIVGTLTYKNFSQGGGRSSEVSIVGGKLTYKVGEIYSDLVWTNGSGDNTWNTTSENWDRSSIDGIDNIAFAGRDSVTFSDDASTKEVLIGSDITAGIVNVEGDYTFKSVSTVEISEGRVLVAGGKTLTLSAEENATLTISSPTTGGG